MPFVGSRWVPGPGEPQEAPQRIGSQIVGQQPVPAQAPSPGYNTGIAGGGGVPDTTGPTPAPQTGWTSQQREQFKNSWMGTGQDRAAQDALLQQQGLTLDKAGRARLPSGELIDLRLGASAGGITPTWTGIAGQGLKTGQKPSLGGGGGDGGIGAGGAAGTTGGATGGPGFGGDIRSSILAQLHQSQMPSAADLQGQYQPFLNELDRGATQARAQLAERLAQQGLNAGGQGGALDAGLNSLNEDLGAQRGRLVSEVTGRELAARRQQIAQALQLGTGVMSLDQQQALQREMAQLDAQLRREGYGVQKELAGQQMGYNYDQLQAEQDYRQAQLRAMQAQYGAGV